MTTVCFIGYGNMAKSIAQGLRNHATWRLIATSPSLSCELDADGVQTHHDNLAHIHEADILILAVKPAKIVSVLRQITPAIPRHCILVSIAAGTSLATLGRECRPEQAIVRCMPNTPIAVGKGATPLIANSYASEVQKKLVEQLFQCSGITTWVEQEQDMNTYTALSGSGPAYVFLMMEAMAAAAQKL
ncbi:MAG: NAD(P)-binding domain-containing protein, partial [Prosthecobacter sp.]|nr:NAD(P)-binding domain-containing protein [Prosthecobacter sp.]